MASLEQLRQRLQDNDNGYGSRFAGQSRASRDLDALDDLIATAQQVAAQADGAAGTPELRAETVQEAHRQLELYRSERTLIVQAKQGGQPLLESLMLGARANVVFHRYARHFAGQGRSSRDGSLLGDMIAELERLQSAMRELQRRTPQLAEVKQDLEVVAGRITQFTDERKEIAKAQTDGTLEEQASALAGMANTLFSQYRAVFGNQPRVTRRPELLVRLLEALGHVRERMRALQAQGLRQQHNDQNVGIVEERLASWHSELTAIRAERQKASLASLVSDLGTAANAEIEAYGQHFAGQSRQTRDLGRLRDIIDRLDDIERQMTRLDEVQASTDNAGNLKVVRDTLVLYANEFDAIALAQNS